MATLGYTTIATEQSPLTSNRFCYANPSTTSSEVGPVISFSIYGQTFGGDLTIQLGLYSDDGDYPDTLLDYTDPWSITNSSLAWITQDAIVGYPLEASTKYWICIFDTNEHVGNQWRMKADANSVDREHINMGDVSTLNDPWSGTSAGSNDQQLSMYLTFTPTGPEEETSTIFSLSHIWAKKTATFNSDSSIYITETATFNSDSFIISEETSTFNSDSFIKGTETATFNSDSSIYITETAVVVSNARIIARGSIENEYKVPRRIQPNMRNTDTTPQTGGQDDGGFRIF